MSNNDRGQAAVMVVFVAAALFMAMSAAMLTIGADMIDRTRAQTAADAAALSAFEGGRGAAAALAERHGAVLVSYERGPGDHQLTVVVRVGHRVARAAASNAP